ncbi:MAG: HPr family phosphocarrier protein [Lachnospiraceae bacterium]|nr:HPr family phosphocarrier protein [Lachnospiraceae bacterium]
MVSRNMTINIPSGLEARPVALLVQVASQYESRIMVQTGDKQINAKSIMGMMSLGLAEGEDLTVTAEGADEVEAVDHIERYLSSR